MTEAEEHPKLERVLSRRDLLLFTVSAILTIDSLPAASSIGVAWFAWWGIIIVLFLIPYGLIAAELGAAWPGEGGLLLWVEAGLGRWWGGMASWLYWITQAYWVPSVYLAFAGTFDEMFLHTRDNWLKTGIALAMTWITVAIGTVRLNVSKWIPNLGAVVKLAIFLGLGGLGIGSLLLGRQPANDFSLAAFVPRWGDSLAFLPVLLYNTFGFELMSGAGGEMRDPQRDVPRAILVSGAVISVAYAFGTLGILLAVPLADLSVVTGAWDALAVLGRPFGAAGATIVFLLGLGFLYACVGNIVTWTLGANRVAATAAESGTFPRALGRLHSRFRTPYVAFMWMGVVATVLLLGNAALSSQADNVFWMIFKLTAFTQLLPYLLVFPCFLILRRTRPDQHRPYRVPGGPAGAWVAAGVSTLFLAVAALLFFKAPPFEAMLLGVETLLTLGVGALLIRRPGRA